MFRRRAASPARRPVPSPAHSSTLSSAGASQSSRSARAHATLTRHVDPPIAQSGTRYGRPRAAGSVSGHSAFTHSPEGTASRTSSTGSGSLGSLESEDEDEADDRLDMDVGAEGVDVGVRPSRKRRRRDEPMSPVAVVLYVVFFYTIWQILTRSDDGEILAHLPPTSPLRNPFGIPLDRGSLGSSSSPYPHMPYHLPTLPSSVSSSSTNGDAASPSTLRLVLGIATYPLYLVFALIAVPVPYLASLALALLGALALALSPLTMTVRLLVRTFVLAPLGLLADVVTALFPLYVFVGAIVGVGIVMGAGAGWVGKVGLDWLLRKKAVAPRRRRVKRDRETHGTHPRQLDAPARADVKGVPAEPARPLRAAGDGAGRFVRLDRLDRARDADAHAHAHSPRPPHPARRTREREPSRGAGARGRQDPTSDSDMTEVPVDAMLGAGPGIGRDAPAGAVHPDFARAGSGAAGTAREAVAVGTRRRERRLQA